MTVLQVPPRYEIFMKLMDDQLDHFWRASGPDKFVTDVADWRALPHNVRRRIKMCVHILAHMDIEILGNLGAIMSELPHANEMMAINMCIDVQRMMENIHTIAYDRIDRELEHDLDDGDMVHIREKVEHLSSYAGQDLPTQILAQSCAEGISFLTLFPIFYYLRKMGILPETCTINDEVLRDENIHTRIFITLYNTLTKDGTMERLPQSRAHEIIRSFVEAEDRLAMAIYGSMDPDEEEFFTVMNVPNSMTYTRIAANSVTQALGYDILYPDVADSNPFPFVNQSVMDTLVGFFDRDSAEYGIRVDHEYESDSDPE